MRPSRQWYARTALLLTLACDEAPTPPPSTDEPTVGEQEGSRADDEPAIGEREASRDEEPESAEPMARAPLPFESVARVRYRELLGRAADEGTTWNAARQRREAAAICRRHFPGERGCPDHVVSEYERGFLEVHRTTEATVRMGYEAGTSPREARQQLRSVVDGSLLSVDGLDVSWVRGWSGSHDALIRRFRQAAGESPTNDGPHECSLGAIARPSGPRETFEENVLARSPTSFADACLRATRALCDTPGCQVSMVAFDDLIGRSARLGHRRIVGGGNERPLPRSAEAPPSAPAARTDRPIDSDFEVGLGFGRRRRRTADSRNGLLWVASGDEPRRRRSYECRLELDSRWPSLPTRPHRPIEVTAEAPESRIAACHAAAGIADLHDTADSRTVDGSVVVDGLRIPASDQRWKGSAALLADRFRASNVPGAEGPADCTVHAVAWTVTTERRVEPDDVPDDFTGALPHQPNARLARTAAYCLHAIDRMGDRSWDDTLLFASGSVVTCAVGDHRARSVRATSERSRGDACAAATERLCEGDCLIELGAIDGVRVDRSKFFRSLFVSVRPPPFIMRNAP